MTRSRPEPDWLTVLNRGGEMCGGRAGAKRAERGKIEKAGGDSTISQPRYHKLQVHLAEHPDAGDLIRGSGGIRKIRCAASGRGKRGGARTLYYWDAPDKIYMIFCYLKNERENITPEQLKTLKKLVEENLK